MIAHTSGFKENIIKLGREIYIKVNYYPVYLNLMTEDNKLILTQDNLQLITERMKGLLPEEEFDENDILSLNKNNLGELFKTYMKSFDLETYKDFNIGDEMIINIGIKVDNEIEYLPYGKYIIYTKTINEDTKAYTYTICDSMLFTMIPYDNDAVFGDNTELTCEEMLESIFSTLNLRYELGELVNGSKVVYKDTFKDLEITYRDVLDMIMQAQGCSLVVSYNPTNYEDTLITKSINTEIVDTIDEDILSNRNIRIKEKFGPINSLLFKRADIDAIENRDETSITENGITQYVIENNLIIRQDNRDTYIENLFDKIKGTEFYTYDIDTIGLQYIEYLDMFAVEANGNTYQCLCLKNTSNIKSGMTETFKAETPTEKALTYKSADKDDKGASILLDKLKGVLVLKVDNNGKIAQVRLDGSADDGSLVEIVSDNIKLEGYTTINGGFSVDLEGNMVAKSGKIAEWTIDDNKGIYTGDGGGQAGLGIFGKAHAFWAGGTDPGTAPFHVGHGGDVSCSDIDITGGSIELKTSGFDNAISVNSSTAPNRGYYIGGTISRATDDNGTQTYILTHSTGNATFSGNVYAANISSDKRKKKNIKDTKVKGVKSIQQMEVKQFDWKKDNKHQSIGLIAQQLEEINPDYVLINEDTKDYYLNETTLVATCIKAIQEQQEQIEELKKEIENLKGGNK